MEWSKLREEDKEFAKTEKAVHNIQKSAWFELYREHIGLLKNLFQKASICAEKLLQKTQKWRNKPVDL